MFLSVLLYAMQANYFGQLCIMPRMNENDISRDICLEWILLTPFSSCMFLCFSEIWYLHRISKLKSVLLELSACS